MNRRKLGRTGLPVSELCFSTMNFGWTIDRETAFALLDAYREAGGAFFQAVHTCQRPPVLLDSFEAPEEWLGDWLRLRSISRTDVVLSTRMTLRGPFQEESVAPAAAIRRCCEDSLRRLGIQYLDLIVCEWQKDSFPIDEILRVFDELIEAGFVRHIGSANFPLWRAMEAIARSAARRRRRFEAVQIHQSSLFPSVAREETLDFCQSYNLGLVVTAAPGDSRLSLRRSREANAATQPSTSTQGEVLGGVLSNPDVSSVVISTHSTGQLRELIDTASVAF